MFIAIICFLLGIALILLRNQSSSKITISMIGFIFIVIGLLTVYQELYGNNRLTTIVLAWLIGGILGCFTLFLGISGIYLRLFLCTEKQEAVFVDLHTYRGSRGRTLYSPMFSYHKGNRIYREKCYDMYFFKRSLEQKFQKGQPYLIYVSRKNPRTFVFCRRIRLTEVLMIALGLSFISVTIYITIRLLSH